MSLYLHFFLLYTVDTCTHYSSVADPGCLSRILIFTHPGSQIQKQQQKRGVKKNLMSYLFVQPQISQNCTFFQFRSAKEKKFGPIFKELQNFLPKKMSLSSQKYGFGIRDPEKTYSGSGVKKAPDPGSATLHYSFINIH